MFLEKVRRKTEGDKAAPKLNITDIVRIRKRKAIRLVSGMLTLSLLIVALGIYTTTCTESISITGYSAGVILAFGSFLGVLGLCLEENRKQLVTAAIVFLSFGIFTSFVCLVVDGVFILLNMDMRPMKAGRCQFYTSGNSYIYENYYTSVPCQGLMESCSMKVRSGTCYCCDLYDCANGGYLNNYYEFVGVQSCQEVLSLYALIWLLTLLNLLAFVLGILTTAVLGGMKDLKSSGDPSSHPLSYESSIIPSPTAPLLMDHNTQTGHQLYPRAAFCASSGGLGALASAASSQTFPPEMQSHPEHHPPPFSPLYNLLPYKP